jgi:hypothetical protein
MKRWGGVGVLLTLTLCPLAGAKGATKEPLLRVVVARQQPVRVVAVHRLHHVAAVVVEIRNESQKRVGDAEFVVAPAECPRSNHPVASILAFPEDASRPVRWAHGLEPGGRAQVLLSDALYRQMIDQQRKAGCGDAARPEIVLRTVAFCDGTGWEGFADGPEHAAWSGRPWAPPQTPRC